MKEEQMQPIILPVGFAGTGLRNYWGNDKPMESTGMSAGIKKDEKQTNGKSREILRRGRPRIPENQRKMNGKQSTYRLAPESKAQLQVIINVLKTSSEVAAVQIAINYLYEHLNEIAPLTATPRHLNDLFAEYLNVEKDVQSS